MVSWMWQVDTISECPITKHRIDERWIIEHQITECWISKCWITESWITERPNVKLLKIKLPNINLSNVKLPNVKSYKPSNVIECRKSTGKITNFNKSANLYFTLVLLLLVLSPTFSALWKTARAEITCGTQMASTTLTPRWSWPRIDPIGIVWSKKLFLPCYRQQYDQQHHPHIPTGRTHIQQ
jgi:hypothetical protein